MIFMSFFLVFLVILMYHFLNNIVNLIGANSTCTHVKILFHMTWPLAYMSLLIVKLSSRGSDLVMIRTLRSYLMHLNPKSDLIKGKITRTSEYFDFSLTHI
jgi:hypothetical protein